MIIRKNQHQLQLMKTAGRISARALREVCSAAKPGVSTYTLNRIAEDVIRSEGATPAFKGYGGFPASICASINEEIVHGIPSKKRILKEGDIFTCDVGAIYQGYVGDNANTVGVGMIDLESQRLISTVRKALFSGIEQCRVGNRLGDVCAAIGAHALREKMGVIRDYVGHGIGAKMHEEPNVPNYGKPRSGPRLEAGMVLAIEPMFALGHEKTRVLRDKWTVVMADGARSAQIEHTVAITENGPQILTQEPGRLPH